MKDVLWVYDSKGFHYEVDIVHSPNIGVSTAYYRSQIISQFQYGRWLLPQGDDDQEWESFQERFMESAGGDALVYFSNSCKEYFDNNP